MTMPATEPVSLAEMFAYMKNVTADDEAPISHLIAAARDWIETYTQRHLITRTVIYRIDSFPARDIAILELPGGTIQSVTSIEYVDSAGVSQTLASAAYEVDTDSEPGRINLAYSQVWPTIREWGLPITITYVSGYGDNPGDVPERIRTAIMRIVSELYEYDMDTIVAVPISRVPWSTRMLVSRFRLKNIF